MSYYKCKNCGENCCVNEENTKLKTIADALVKFVNNRDYESWLLLENYVASQATIQSEGK